MNLPILTYTLLRDFENCPHKAFRKYVKKDIKYKATPAMAEGARDHDALMNRLKKGTVLDPHLRIAEPVCAIFDVLPDTVPYRVEYMIGMLVDGSPCQWDNHNVWLRLKPDVACWSPAGGWIVDWKTGKPWEDPFELNCQAMVLAAHHPEVPFWKGEYFWTKQGPGQRYDLDPAQTFARAAESWGKMHAYKAAADALQPLAEADEAWPRTPNKLCHWCDVVDCPHNTKDQTDG
jgi:hypothetical protein